MPKKTKNTFRKLGLNSKEWDAELVEQFIGLLMDFTLSKDVRELKNHIIPECVWKKLEAELDIEWKHLEAFWHHRLHIQLFSPDPIYTNDVKIKLIEYFYGKGITNFQDFHWSRIISSFDGYTSDFLRKTFLNLNRGARANTGSSDLGENIEYLYKRHMTHLKQLCRDQMIPRLTYTKGRIKHVDADVKIILSSVKKSSEDNVSDDDEISSNHE